jgi:hypothetical protein
MEKSNYNKDISIVVSIGLCHINIKISIEGIVKLFWKHFQRERCAYIFSLHTSTIEFKKS